VAMAGSAEARYVVSVERVQEAISVLLERKSHPWFPAYMDLRRAAAVQDSLDDIEPSWVQLQTELRVCEAPSNRPYLRPFWNQARNKHQEWLNENGAGSWAPSSIRAGQPPFYVVEPHDGRFRLREGHAQLALEYLLYSERIPALAIAAFMLRDRALRSGEPTPESLISAFGREFGYKNDQIDEFETLYDPEWRGSDISSPWLEPVETAEF
jgi:hypothetical protein